MMMETVCSFIFLCKLLVLSQNGNIVNTLSQHTTKYTGYLELQWSKPLSLGGGVVCCGR